jgi:hypothetical protein
MRPSFVFQWLVVRPFSEDTHSEGMFVLDQSDAAPLNNQGGAGVSGEAEMIQDDHGFPPKTLNDHDRCAVTNDAMHPHGGEMKQMEGFELCEVHYRLWQTQGVTVKGRIEQAPPA